MRCKTLAFLLALALPSALLAGCGATADIADAATDETAATGENADAEDPYAYLADFDYSALFDDKGYIKDVTALDYVTLPEGYTAPELPAGTDTVSDEDVDGMIEQEVLYNFAESVQITDRAAAMGDTVNIDYVGSVDGVEFEGGSTGGSGTTLQLTGSNYIDDFEEQIAGHTPGESFDVVVTFPDPYQNNPDMAGKEAVFKTTLNYIVEDQLPELTDDFVAENLAADLGCETVEELQEYFREQLLYSQCSNAVYAQLADTVIYAGELPQQITDYFTDWVLYSYYQYAVAYGMTLEDFLAAAEYESVDAFLDEMQDAINSNVQQLLLDQAMAEDLGLTCDAATMEANAKQVFGGADLDGYRDYYGEGYMKMIALEYLTMQNILQNATYAED